MDSQIKVLQKRAANIRRLILAIGSGSGRSAHFGGALSLVEIVTALFCHTFNGQIPGVSPNCRDRFVLSKGHGFLAYLAVLCELGAVDLDEALTFQQDGSRFIAHPVKNLDLGIETSSGSLGQGLSFSVGLAEGMKKNQKDGRVFVICGDGECNEGCVWEAMALAAQRNLNNLTIIIDANGFQNDSSCDLVFGHQNLQAILLGNGVWVTVVENGHDVAEVIKCIESASAHTSGPSAVICKTIKGAGVEFMENDNDWHHGALTAAKLKVEGLA